MRRRPAARRPRADAAAPAGRAPWGWALAGVLLGLLLTTLLAAPARWLAAGVAQASGGVVQLAEPQGSLWSGSARLLLTGGAGSQDRSALPGRVHWRLRPGWGALALRLNADCCTPAGPLGLRLSPRWGGARLALADAHSVWPAALLAGLGTPFNTLQPQGELNLSTQALALQWQAGRASVQGQADVTLRQLSSRVATLRPLGSYRVQLRGGDTPTLAVTLNFANAEIEAVARTMATITGRNVVVDPRVKGQLTLITEHAGAAHGRGFQQFLAALRLQGFTVVESAGLYKVVPEADAKLQGGSVSVSQGGATGGPGGRADRHADLQAQRTKTRPTWCRCCAR
jgi:general secretion pathway protein N